MSGRTSGTGRRQLGLKRETLRSLSQRDLGQVAGGSWLYTEACIDESCDCFASADCNGYSTGTRYC